jgi:hypothetical protein
MVVFKKPPDKLWFPTLLQVSNNIDTNSWFNMLQKNNPNKQNLQKDTGMLKGRIDTSDLYKSEIQLTGKGFDTYDGLENLKWEEVFEKYS